MWFFQTRPKSAQAFAYEDGLLYVQSAHVLTPRRSHSLSVELPVSLEGQETLTIHIKALVLEKLERTRLFEKRCQDCFGHSVDVVYSLQLEGPKEVLPHLESLLLPLPQPQELRAQPRVEKRLRATSPQLPGFRGTVVDLSVTGLGLLVDGPLQRGQGVLLEVEFEDQRSQRLQLPCVVCWCRPEEGAPYRAGLRFEAMNEDLFWDLKELVRALLALERGVLNDSRYHRR